MRETALHAPNSGVFKKEETSISQENSEYNLREVKESD